LLPHPLRTLTPAEDAGGVRTSLAASAVPHAGAKPPDCAQPAFHSPVTVRGELRQVYGLGDGVSLPRRDVHHPLPGSPPDVTEPAQGYAQPQDQAAAMANPAPEDIGPLDVKSTARERADVYMRTTFPNGDAAKRSGFTPAMAEKLGPDGKFPMPGRGDEYDELDKLVPHNVRRAYNNNFTARVSRENELLSQRRNDELDISPQRQLLCEPMAEENERAENEELRAKNSLLEAEVQQLKAEVRKLQKQHTIPQQQPGQVQQLPADDGTLWAEETGKDGRAGSEFHEYEVDWSDWPDWPEERARMQDDAVSNTPSG
jgi:hypothetical protein